MFAPAPRECAPQSPPLAATGSRRARITSRGCCEGLEGGPPRSRVQGGYRGEEALLRRSRPAPPVVREEAGEDRASEEASVPLACLWTAEQGLEAEVWPEDASSTPYRPGAR